MVQVDEMLKKIGEGDYKALARAITIVENELEGFDSLLMSISPKPIPVIGFTGPPGAGKSTLINAILTELSKNGKKTAVVAVDPTSPFNFGSLLGDRLRMSEHFNDPNIYIRSLATRGSLGGLSDKIIEVVDILKCSAFDYIIVETVGVGQSEVEIAGLADITVVVFVPESGDEVQTLKSGIMEIADIFIVNKSDREGADNLVNNLKKLMHQPGINVPVIKTSATNSKGIAEVLNAINSPERLTALNEKKSYLLTEKLYRMIRKRRMSDIDKNNLKKTIEAEMNNPGFNLYRISIPYIGHFGDSIK